MRIVAHWRKRPRLALALLATLLIPAGVAVRWWLNTPGHRITGEVWNHHELTTHPPQDAGE